MKLVPLTFDVDHTHAGKPITRGTKHPGIPAYWAQYLIEHGIAHRTPFTTAQETAPEASSTETTETTEATEENDHEQ